MKLLKLNSTRKMQSTGIHCQKMPEWPPTWRNFNPRTLFPIRVTALLFFFKPPYHLPLNTVSPGILLSTSILRNKYIFFIWLVGFYSKLFSQQWAALVVDKSSCCSERVMKALFAEGESKSVYRLSNNAWVIWYEGNLAVNCRSCSSWGSHNLFL